MKVIGITGGIGSGKSTVTKYLQDRGYTVIDADRISREIVEDPSVISEIRELAGDDLITENGKLDRKKTADLIFSDDSVRHDYEELVTRRTVERVKEIIKDFRSGVLKTKDGILFLDAPLLFETGTDKLTDIVWLVTADEEKRLDRVESRDSIARADILARIKTQMSEDKKKELSDVIIENNGTIEDLYKILEGII